MPFTNVVGHRSLIGLIARAHRRGTLPPSLLFAGPDGVGKMAVAIALAQVQNCPDVVTRSGEPDACGQCSTCRRIERGSFSDVLLIEPGEKTSITVDPIRHAIGQATYRPFEGRRRVVIVSDADRLVVAAQQALLKTLEEPSESSQFVLVTSRPDVLLATVRSRCQRLAFGQLTVAEVAAVLGRVDGGDASEVRAAAAASGGSVGRARQLASGELAGARDAALMLLQTVSTARDARARLEGAKAFLPKGKAPLARRDLRRRLGVLTSVLRDIELVETGSDPARLANRDLTDRLRALARTFGGRRGVSAFAAVNSALEAVDGNVSPKAVADWLVCQM
jgi:DNA polymerase-3 subunit delta'